MADEYTNENINTGTSKRVHAPFGDGIVRPIAGAGAAIVTPQFKTDTPATPPRPLVDRHLQVHQAPTAQSPTYSPEQALYRWAKSIHTALTGEPRHSALDQVYVELGLALKSYERAYLTPRTSTNTASEAL